MRNAFRSLTVTALALSAGCAFGPSGNWADGNSTADAGTVGNGDGGGSSTAGRDGGGGGSAGGDASVVGSDASVVGSDTGAPPTEAGVGAPTIGGIFQQPEPWTTDVSAMTKDARSDAIIAALVAMGGWGGGNQLQIDFSIPLFFADGSTPRQTITADPSGYCYGGPDCDAVPLQMPLPTNGNTEGSASYTCDVANNDCHILVVAKNENKLYELYNATQEGSAFTALGAFVWDLTKAYPDNGRGEQCTSADAAGFPIAGLLPTADEVAAGEVKHALRFILPNDRMKSTAYVHPASHAGSPSSSDANAPPYGVRFRLKASFDETPFNTGEKVILEALKTYGMLLSDGGNIALTFADDRLGPAKWQDQGITAQSFGAIGADNFEVVDLSAEITLTDNCVRNP